MTVSYFNGPRSSAARPWDLVVPTDTASVLFQRLPLDPISTFVDTLFAPEYNLLFPGLAATRKATKTRRAIFFVLRASSAMAGAPGAVTALAATLATKNDQAFAIHATRGGDVWIVGNLSDGVRHGGYDLLRRLGVEYLNPNPAWRQVVPRGSWELDVSEVCEPVYESFEYAGNGGFGSSTAPPVPGRAAAINQWTTWWTQKRMPASVIGFTDGDEDFTKDRQDELRHDHTMLAWVPAVSKRGFSETGNFPSVPNNGGSGAKNCNTHHGSSGGSFPAPPAGPDVWSSVTYRIEDATTFAPGGPLSLDPGPDTGVNPSTSYTAIGGGALLHAVHKVERICSRIQSLGYPHAQTKFVSSEPNDGSGKCRCDRCIDLLRNGPYAAYLTPTQQTQDSTFADCVWNTANFDQYYLQNHFTNAQVPGTGAHFCPGTGVLAYTIHCEPPSIPIHQNSLAMVLPLNGPEVNLLPSELVTAWVAKQAANPWGAFKLGVGPVFNQDFVVLGRPYWPSPADAAALNADWIAQNYTYFSAFTGYSSLSSGIVWWLLAKQVWDPALDAEAEIARWFEVGFGPVAADVRVMFDRIWQWWEATPHEIGKMVRDTDNMLTALAAQADPVSYQGREAIRTRLDHVRAWVHAQRLSMDHADARQLLLDGALDASGSGTPPGLFITGTRTKPCVIRVEMESATTYKWTRNADHPAPFYEETGVALPAPGGTKVLGNTNCTLNFPTAGTYATGQAWTQLGPLTRYQAALDAACAWLWRIVKHDTIHTNRVTREAWLKIPYPTSACSEGSSPPNVTIGGSLTAGSLFVSTAPTVGTTYVDVEIDSVAGGTALGQATFLWKRNGSTVASGVTTAASVSLTSAGVQAFFPAGPYAVGHKWHFTIDPMIEKWQENLPGSAANWTTLIEPTRTEITTAINADIADYVPVTGISRLVDPLTSFQSFNVSGATTLQNTPWCDSATKYVIKTGANPTTIKLEISSKAGPIGVPVRLLLLSMTGTVLQTLTVTPPGAGPSLVTDLVITQPAGLYRLCVATTLQCLAYTRLNVPQNVGCVWINDSYDAPAVCTSDAFDAGLRQYFYVPAAQTKILLAFDTRGQMTGDFTHLVQFYDPSGVAVATTRTGLSQWTCAVGAGQDNTAWSFKGLSSRSTNTIWRFENCPARLAPSPYQLLIP